MTAHTPIIIDQPTSTTELMMNLDAMNNMYRLAETMAGGKATVPQHLQGNVADCMAIVMQSALWRMNPFAVAQKTHVVSGTLGYEAQLVNAVVKHSGSVQGAFHYEFFGDWSKVIGNFITKTNQNGKPYQAPNWTPADEKGLGVKVFNTLAGESEPRPLELLLSQAQVRNSTLWASDPKQQLAYLAVKRWARLYCPEAILGVYSADELESERPERDITPQPEQRADSRLNQVLSGATVQQEAIGQPAQAALPSPFEKLSLSLNDCTTIQELDEVAAEIATAIQSHKVNDSEKKHLGAIYKNRKERLQPKEPEIDYETGEVA
ncbi:RecT family recombinase [Shewanella sp. MM_2022_3]|uniref:RecT family recombinase n=1 Tax=Shewanella sp. MM_2022_3 TaxID=2923280 RepID=UPI002409177C|nr:RecT family recombinase [Shewanella sp. MM_2022_3]